MLGVLYLLSNEGYSATAGDDWMRPVLCEEALRLGRILAGLVPREPEVHGLVALMEIQSSRTAARTGSDGQPVLIQDQDRGRWDRLLIRRGLAALERAESLTATPGTYVLQAAIAACHARAATANETNWQGIAALYAALVAVTGSPVVELNRAIALSKAYGPPPALRCSTCFGTARSCAATTCCPAPAAICSPSSVVPTRHARSSSGPPPWQTTNRSGRCFLDEPRGREGHRPAGSELVIDHGRLEPSRCPSTHG